MGQLTVAKSAAALLATALAHGGYAATFSVACDGSLEQASKGCTIYLRGRIESGDSNRLLQVLKRPLPPEWTYRTVFLDSPGGDVESAIQVAGIVRKALLNTSTSRYGPRTYEKGNCVSACFLVWVAGAERSALGEFSSVKGSGDLGLHRPFLSPSAYHAAPDQVAAQQQRATALVSEYLQREHVPRRLIDAMLQYASTQVYWATLDDVNDIGGRSPWFTEMMISRCSFDPSFESTEELWQAQEVLRSKANVTSHPRYRKYLSWRQQYNRCEYNIREKSQSDMRRGGP